MYRVLVYLESGFPVTFKEKTIAAARNEIEQFRETLRDAYVYRGAQVVKSYGRSVCTIYERK